MESRDQRARIFSESTWIVRTYSRSVIGALDAHFERHRVAVVREARHFERDAALAHRRAAGDALHERLQHVDRLLRQGHARVQQYRTRSGGCQEAAA